MTSRASDRIIQATLSEHHSHYTTPQVKKYAFKRTHMHIAHLQSNHNVRFTYRLSNGLSANCCFSLVGPLRWLVWWEAPSSKVNSKYGLFESMKCLWTKDKWFLVKISQPHCEQQRTTVHKNEYQWTTHARTRTHTHARTLVSYNKWLRLLKRF